MPRPRKHRRVCSLPECSEFGPLHSKAGLRDFVLMSIDEYECIRLIDLEGLTQEECSDQMEVGRTTVQAIYKDARFKIADCLVNLKRLVITGGEIQLCNDQEQICQRGCFRGRKERLNKKA